MTQSAAPAISRTRTWPRPPARPTGRPAGGGSPHGRADRKVTPARSAVIRQPDGATYLRCGGCAASSVFIQSERRYGHMVRDFLDQHDHCGGAVEISAAQRSVGQSADRPLVASGLAGSLR